MNNNHDEFKMNAIYYIVILYTRMSEGNHAACIVFLFKGEYFKAWIKHVFATTSVQRLHGDKISFSSLEIKFRTNFHLFSLSACEITHEQSTNFLIKSQKFQNTCKISCQKLCGFQALGILLRVLLKSFVIQRVKACQT